MDALLDKVVGSSTWNRALDGRDLQNFVSRHEQRLSELASQEAELQDEAFDLEFDFELAA